MWGGKLDIVTSPLFARRIIGKDCPFGMLTLLRKSPNH